VFLIAIVMMMAVMMMVMRMGRMSPPLTLAAVRVKKER
jgi:hypothetical protein